MPSDQFRLVAVRFRNKAAIFRVAKLSDPRFLVFCKVFTGFLLGFNEVLEGWRPPQVAGLARVQAVGNRIPKAGDSGYLRIKAIPKH